MNLHLAPLAGFSDSPFRLIAREFGANVLYTEMVSVEGVFRNNKKTLDYFNTLEKDAPITVQLFGTNINSYLKSLEILNKLDYVDGVNINCGCPVKKVVKTGSGGAMLKTPHLIAQIIKNLKKNTNKTVSIKIRSGWEEENTLEIAKIAQDALVDYIILHPRTVKMGYSGKANWEQIKLLKDNLKIKVVGNGDIERESDMVKYKDYADEIMIGRAAIGNPWIFDKDNKVLNLEFKNTIFRHINNNEKFYGDLIFQNMKKHIPYYLKNIDVLKSEKNILFLNLFRSQSISEFKDILNKFFELKLGI